MTDDAALTIGEAAEITGVGVHALRYYERQRLLTVPRTEGGQRRYGEVELASVRFITQLRRTGMPIAVIREYADLVRAGDDTTQVRLDYLEAHRSAVLEGLAEQQRHLAAITAKIDAYTRLLERERHPAH